MQEEVQLYLEDSKERMEKAISHLEESLTHIRAGKANTKLLDGVMVMYYGAPTPLAQVSNVSTPDAKTIVIQPWEKNIISDIEKAIINSSLGLNPDNNGEMIRLSIPALTEERRASLSRQVKQEGEDSKIIIRNIRRDANEAFKKMKKDGLSEDLEKDAATEAQKLTDAYAAKIDVLIAEKEKEIMTV